MKKKINRAKYNNPITFEAGDIIQLGRKKMTVIHVGKNVVKVYLWGEDGPRNLFLECFRLSRPYKIIYKYKDKK